MKQEERLDPAVRTVAAALASEPGGVRRDSILAYPEASDSVLDHGAKAASSTPFEVTIAATGAFLPGDPLVNDELELLAGPMPPDVLAGIQVRRRHWMIDPATGDHRYSVSEMAERATRQALERAGLEPAEVDLLVVSTASPEYLLPATVTSLQARLGLSRVATLELRSGCAGAVQALDVGRRFLEEGTYKTAVVVGCEAISPLLAPVYLGRSPASIRLRDRLNVYTFGDGAGAMVLKGHDRTNDSGKRAGVLGSVNACLGGNRSPGMQIIGSGTDIPIADQLRRVRLVDLRVDIKQSAEFGPRLFLTALSELLQASGLTVDDVDACVLPEGNAEYFTGVMDAPDITIEQWARIHPKIVENLADVGATGSAAVPIALDHAWTTGAIRSGDTVLLMGIEASRWIAAGLAIRWGAGPAGCS